MSKVLYEKHVSANGKVSYKEYVAQEEPKKEVKNSEFEPEQIITMVGTMGICLIESISRLLPSHTRISREVTKANQALLTLFRNTGQPLDPVTVEWCVDCWNETMRRISEGVPTNDDTGTEGS